MTWAEVARNCVAVCEYLGLGDGEVLVSWLPLSHDFGLIGSLLTSCLSGLAGTMVLARPEEFVSDPASWFQLCSEYRATVTVGPDFAWRMAATSARAAEVDLSSLRISCNGSELTRYSTFELLSRLAGPLGWSPQSLCCAYGMAEAGLAVTGRRTGDPLVALDVNGRFFDPVATAAVAAPIAPGALLSSGRPLPGFDVRTSIDRASDDGMHTSTALEVCGPSLATAYLDGATITGPDGWFPTSDLGVFDAEGNLFVTGRHDEFVTVAGSNLPARVIEEQIALALDIRPTKVAAFSGDVGLSVVVEASRPLDDAARASVRRAARQAAGTSPAEVSTMPLLPRTTSGKLRRRELLRLLAGQEPGDR